MDEAEDPPLSFSFFFPDELNSMHARKVFLHTETGSVSMPYMYTSVVGAWVTGCGGVAASSGIAAVVAVVVLAGRVHQKCITNVRWFVFRPSLCRTRQS